jgi:hypothetical protein
VTFTAADRAKALETRKHNAEQRRLLKQNQVTGVTTTSSRVEAREPVKFSGPLPDPESFPVIIEAQKFPWYDAPLDEAVECLNAMKRNYDRAAQIVLQRQSRQPRVWSCWTQKHKQLAGRTAVAQCRGQIPDGKWVFKDDGAKDAEGKLDPQVCCSQICFTAYQQRPRNISALSRH